jgi:Phosphoribosylaminoimidazole carboxylase (NCAIR synthetase)
MVNILGLAALPIRELEQLGKVYWYGKAEARPRRKMGHVNTTAETTAEAKAKARIVLTLLYDRKFTDLVMKPRTRAIHTSGP